MPARPRLLLFDLDGVLVRYDRRLRCELLAQQTGATAGEVSALLFGDTGLETRSDRGELGLPELLQAIQRDAGWQLTPAQYLRARQAATQVDEGMLGLCQDLAAESDLAIFTNNGHWLAEHIGAVAPALLSLFEGRIICSGHLRQAKPRPEAFAACLRRLGAHAAETLFVDDRRDNVEGARAAGLRAEWFENTEVLRAQLRDQGFLDGAGHED